jgi:CubicO group peptidase (beta-lactamase class C family)
MLSTIKDYFRFSQMILNGGQFEGKRYLQASTIDMMHTSVLEPGANLTLGRFELKGLGFGLGVAIVHDPVVAATSEAAQSYFWSGLFGTSLWIDPVNDLIVIGCINHVNDLTPAGGSTMAPSVRDFLPKFVYKMMDESGRN